MTTALQLATVVVYADDVAEAVAFHERVTGLAPSYYDRELGFALLGPDQAVAIASHAAGALMLEAGYERVRGARVRGAEIAFRAEDVAAALRPRPTSFGANHRAPGEGGHAAEPWRWAAQERVTQLRGSRWQVLP